MVIGARGVQVAGDKVLQVAHVVVHYADILVGIKVAGAVLSFKQVEALGKFLARQNVFAVVQVFLAQKPVVVQLLVNRLFAQVRRLIKQGLGML